MPNGVSVPFVWLTLFFCICFVHFKCQAQTVQVGWGNEKPKEAYVSLLYGDTYVLPLRVMMLSLLKNSPDIASGRRERLVLVTAETSERAVAQLLGDGIKTIRVDTIDSPYKRDQSFDLRFLSVMTKLKIFGLEKYRKLVFVDADSLVFSDMSPLFECGQFCAAFINPCFFNSGLMLVTPNASVLKDMVEKLPTMNSYDGGDQGFLNAYYPKLLDAPAFRPELNRSGGNVLRRLPAGWHVDHSAYYPRFSFDFSSKRCGQRKETEFLGPQFAKPWYWWTYAVLDISWEWYEYRRQLDDPYPPGRPNTWSAATRVLLCYVGAYFMGSYALSSAFWRRDFQRQYVETSGGSYIWPFQIRTRPLLLVALILGIFEWTLSLLAAVFLTPAILMPNPAILVYIHIKWLSITLLILAHGAFLCTKYVEKSESDVDNHYYLGSLEKDLRWLIFECVFLAFIDAQFIPMGLAVLWKLPFATMWSKIAYSLLACCVYLAFILAMYARVSLRWVRFAAFHTRRIPDHGALS